MEKFFNFLDRRVAAPMSMISEQPHIRAIRDGVISAIPFIIAGSLILIIAAPPVPETSGFAMWVKDHADQILIPYRMTFGIMSLMYASESVQVLLVVMISMALLVANLVSLHFYLA